LLTASFSTALCVYVRSIKGFTFSQPTQIRKANAILCKAKPDTGLLLILRFFNLQNTLILSIKLWRLTHRASFVLQAWHLKSCSLHLCIWCFYPKQLTLRSRHIFSVPAFPRNQTHDLDLLYLHLILADALIHCTAFKWYFSVHASLNDFSLSTIWAKWTCWEECVIAFLSTCLQ